ncbi:hypothetical protein FAM21834_00103 [Lentilactobacillus parabuchneri]|jgi:hypothetical protein|uniref:Uncharacterized protein n=1 Tax=Lentilactobacillus parabuchneri TaxID=152331 RepID=A0A1X1FI47_9LACO|nr:hypothetical protein [Lentilactobacillus parabuchneri]APR06387.1 hypothetical protein FAM21731_00121 [Lentilactobacillus parabuchneri]KRN77892.1 hypothetical protein IV42_GL002391 [Lentilactobacillus parabuchneri]MBW0221607.1 hypothetical protein [Lentilactobacillus parabuchneri]MBW0245168.1 hypothetical protein [Lentilactobacillus parabuchneri]MBW0263247.1 hypothetical protein [Lentilactobacillus parabuchneri]
MAMFQQLKTGWQARVRYFDKNGEQRMAFALNQWPASGQIPLKTNIKLAEIWKSAKSACWTTFWMGLNISGTEAIC